MTSKSLTNPFDELIDNLEASYKVNKTIFYYYDIHI